jgi:hypothetical protein
MAAYCNTMLQGDRCTDSQCPYRHDLVRCEPCGRSLPASALKQHQKGKDHLRNVTSSHRSANSGTPRQPPCPPSQPSSSSRPQFTPRADASPIPRDDAFADATNVDPRVSVSGEDVFDFVAEGTGTMAHPIFPPISHTILIENTSSSSNLSVQSMKLVPSPNPWCESSGDRIQSLMFRLVALLHLYLARRC